MLWIGVDLGSTNIKAGLYDERMRCLRMESAPVEYVRENGYIEFDAQAYVGNLRRIIRLVASEHSGQVATITFTGQAESLVVLGADGAPLMRAISWMDERSVEECALLEENFPGAECYAHTGQPAALSTWPATKILWLSRHRPDVFDKAKKYVMLKDYVVYCMTGKLLADRSIATFTFYFDIYEKQYWREMLNFIGVDETQLPPLVEPCTVAGDLLPEVAQDTGLSPCTSVNIGTLDHFAGMVGTGNVQAGDMSLSIGTVMGISTMAVAPVRRDTGIPMHYGFIPDTYVMLPVAESGGVSLEWFKNACMKDVSYAELNRVLNERPIGEIVFLPYLVGANAPEFDLDACGMFYGLRARSDAFDMARAVMEGVAYLLRANCESICASGTSISRIIATGGGAKSSVWCQIQADITGIPVDIPKEKEAACLGAALIGAVAAGVFPSYAAAAESVVRMEHRFSPARNAQYERKYRQYRHLYDAMLAARRME